MDNKKSFFTGLSRKHYLELLRSLPPLQKERVREYTTLILSFFALSFFGFFAIGPTLTTITDLKKQVDDNKQADLALKTKIKNLSTLQQLYTSLEPELPLIDAAIPLKPDIITLLGKTQALALKANVEITALQVNEISLLKPAINTNKKISKTPTVNFLIRASGSEEHLLSFLSSVIDFDRLVTLESATIMRDLKQKTAPSLSIRATAYFMP